MLQTFAKLLLPALTLFLGGNVTNPPSALRNPDVPGTPFWATRAAFFPVLVFVIRLLVEKQLFFNFLVPLGPI